MIYFLTFSSVPAANRTDTRAAVVQTVFELEFRGNDKWEELLVRNFDEMTEECAGGELDRAFGTRLATAVFSNLLEIRTLLTTHAPDWPYEKIARLDRAVLLVALAELKFLSEEKIPVAVTLNEYVEIAKNFGGDSGRRFVNGVLSAVKKEMA